ncbi:transposase [Roseateles puraquae]|uniref:Transposase n=1 Tax=Roseateles puraquae TaxID=431059 RepID=A0A254NMH4_9BURK|nr:transposase [Roseateles puraquae]MDG0853572.1 hypothetical protein [Roseateles puraquae]OWR05743.1 hypothetical protein CDO81_04650 [Roseateles puraquae]
MNSDELKRTAIDLVVTQGRSVASVSEELNVRSTSVISWLRYAGVSLKGRPRPNVKVSHELRARAVAQIAGGSNVTDIAESLGVTAAAVYRWMRMAGVQKPKHSHRSKSVRYSDEFKRDAVRQVKCRGTIQTVSVETRVSHQTLRNWVIAHGGQA